MTPPIALARKPDLWRINDGERGVILQFVADAIADTMDTRSPMQRALDIMGRVEQSGVSFGRVW